MPVLSVSTRLSPPRLQHLALRGAMMLGVLGIATAAATARAEPSPALDRVSLSVGAFSADPRINIGADTQFGRIDAPESKQSRTTIPRVKADLLIGDRHGLAFDYYRYDKSYTPSLTGDTIINGQPVTGTATARDSISEHAFAPLLEVGWRHAFTPDLRMYAEASGIKKNGGRINGHIYGGNIGVEWFPFKNIGFVADYGMSKIKRHRDSERDADLNIRLTGPSAYVKVRKMIDRVSRENRKEVSFNYGLLQRA